MDNLLNRFVLIGLLVAGVAYGQNQISDGIFQPSSGGGGGSTFKLYTGGTLIGTETGLNIIDGNLFGPTSCSDNPGANRVDCTLNASTSLITALIQATPLSTPTLGTTPLVWELANNAGTGTTQFKTVTSTGAPATATLATIASTAALLGCSSSATSTTGNAQIGALGTLTCTSDGAVTASHWVTKSTTTDGAWHDAGTTPPSGACLWSLNTIGSAGTFQAAIPLPGQCGAGGAVNTNSMTRPAFRHWTLIEDTGTGATILGTGQTTTGTITHNLADSNMSVAYTGFDTGTGANASSADSETNPNMHFVSGTNTYFETRLSNPTCCTNQRVWLGITDQSVSTQSNTDTPSGSWLAFRESSTAGDTNYKCGGSSAGTALLQDTGVVADTASHTFTITVNDGANTATCAIDGVNVVTVASANVPPRTVLLKMFAVVNNITAAASRTLRVASLYEESTPQ